jgi:hypothetical protein
LYGRPPCGSKQVEADDPVAVDVWVRGDWAGAGGGVEGYEADFRGLYGVVGGEEEGQAEDLVGVDGVGVEHADVHLPFAEVVGEHELDSRGELDFGFLQFLGWVLVLRGRNSGGCCVCTLPNLFAANMAALCVRRGL